MQRKVVALWALCAVAAAFVAGCGPKPSEKEKNWPPPASAKNVRGGYVPPPAGANRATPPMPGG
jgi:hypothetical protein